MKEPLHVSNPLRYANYTTGMLKKATEDCDGFNTAIYIGLVSRYIEDAYYMDQINAQQAKDMYDNMSDLLTKFHDNCKCIKK